MLVSELITWCNGKYEPDETTSFDISDTTWIRYFNQCIIEYKAYFRIPITETANIVSGQTNYALPKNDDGNYGVASIDRLFQSSNGSDYSELYYVDLREDIPLNRYTIFDNELIISEPGTSVTNGLKMFYHKDHETIDSTGDTIEIENPYLIGYFALSEVEEADRQTTEAERYRQKFMNSLSNLSQSEEINVIEFKEVF